jgi:hypothetical protein
VVTGSFGVILSSQGEVPSKMASSGILPTTYASRATGRKYAALYGRMKPYLLSRMSFASPTYVPIVDVSAKRMSEGIGR